MEGDFCKLKEPWTVSQFEDSLDLLTKNRRKAASFGEGTYGVPLFSSFVKVEYRYA